MTLLGNLGTNIKLIKLANGINHVNISGVYYCLHGWHVISRLALIGTIPTKDSRGTLEFPFNKNH